jgi:hypothetical protein
VAIARSAIRRELRRDLSGSGLGEVGGARLDVRSVVVGGF